MSEALLENFMQIQRKIVDPHDVYDQANGCRAMLLTIEALFLQGKLSQEARDYLHIEYSALLNNLWQDDLGKAYDKFDLEKSSTCAATPPIELGVQFGPKRIPPKISPIVTEEAIKHTLEYALCKRSRPSIQESLDAPMQRSSEPTKKPTTSGPVFSSASSLLAEKNPELFKKPVDEMMNHPELAGIQPEIKQRILTELMSEGPGVSWDEIAGLEYAKRAVQEMIVWPLLRPDIFTGPREPPRGMLLFGPPGTGKTLIGKCIATEAKATFFNVSASSLVSKWVGESNLLVRALFAVARAKQPSIIFLDELDSLLASRGSDDHKHDRQLITELFVQLDGAKTYKDNRVIFIGATNRPSDLDDAARRRLVKRLYIALPDKNARKIIMSNIFKNIKHDFTEDQREELAIKTKGEFRSSLRRVSRLNSRENDLDIPKNR